MPPCALVLSHISQSVASDAGVDEDVDPVGLLEQADAVATERLLPRGHEQRSQQMRASGEDAYRRQQPLVGQLDILLAKQKRCWCYAVVVAAGDVAGCESCRCCCYHFSYYSISG